MILPLEKSIQGRKKLERANPRSKHQHQLLKVNLLPREIFIENLKMPANVNVINTEVYSDNSYPVSGNYSKTGDFISAFANLKIGWFDNGITVSVRGLVTVKTDKAHNFKMYKIVDEKDKTNEIRVICLDSEYVPIDGMTFEEMHEDVEEGDVVKVSGYPSRSYKGNMCIYCSSILVKKYGDNEYDLEDDFIDDSMIENKEVDDDETDYDDDDKLFDENVVEEDEEEEEFLEFDAEDDHYIIDSVPLKIYKDHVVYNNVLLEILSCRVDTPGKLGFITRKVDDKDGERIKFTVTHLCKNFLGIMMEGNTIDEDKDNTYDVIEKGKFRELVEILM